jgi:hypothetical protein
MLKPGGYWSTDGIRESYSRVMRLDSKELYTLLNDQSLMVWMIVTNSDEPKSLVIYKKSGDEAKDFFFKEEHLVNEKDGNLILLESSSIKVRTGWGRREWVLEPYFSTALNLNRMYIRDQIWPANMDEWVHKIIKDFSLELGRREQPTMLVAILTLLATTETTDSMTVSRIREYVTREVATNLSHKSSMGIVDETRDKLWSSRIWSLGKRWKWHRPNNDTMRFKWGRPD